MANKKPSSRQQRETLLTDSLKDAQSAITLVDDKPNWELTAEVVAYPLQIQATKKTFEIYVHLKRYQSDRLISILNAVPGSYRRNVGDVEAFGGDDSKFSELTDECFVKMEGVDSQDVALQKKWLEQNPRQKIRIARDLLGGAEIDTDFPEDVPTEMGERLELLPLALECRDSSTLVVQELWDPNRRLKTKVRMTHSLRAETEQDWRLWGRTGSERFNKATKQWTSNINWWKRIEMYDAMAMSLGGMTLSGQPCTAANKADWVKLVPAWHKLLVVTSVFDETRVKNA